MPPATYLVLVLLFSPAVILAEPFHVPLSRRHSLKVENLANAANNLRIKYGYQTPTPQRRAAAAAGIGLLDQNQDTSYLGTVTVGTPPQSFESVLDTGSSDFWVIAPNCVNCPKGAPTFDTSTSSTFQVPSSTSSNAEVNIKYGSGAVTGTLGRDVVSMGGFEIEKQVLLTVNGITGNIIDKPAASIMGFAFTEIASTGAVPFWLALINNGLLPNPIMSFFLARNIENSASSLVYGGVFTLGGTNTTLFSGDIEYLDILNPTTPTFWLLPLVALTVNNKPVVLSITNASCAIDTGTTLIGGPADDVANLWAAVPGAKPGKDAGFFEFPCGTTFVVAMSFGGKSWSINSKDMNLGADPRSSTSTNQICVGAVFILNVGTSVGSSSAVIGNPDWVVGDTFLKNVYSVFRSDGSNTPSVGFAELSTGAGGSGTAQGASPSSTTTTTQSAALSTTIPGFLMLSTAFIATIFLCL